MQAWGMVEYLDSMLGRLPTLLNKLACAAAKQSGQTQDHVAANDLLPMLFCAAMQAWGLMEYLDSVQAPIGRLFDFLDATGLSESTLTWSSIIRSDCGYN
jgi:hypothetical protein